MKNLNNFEINEKKVLFRADLNVPLVDGIVTDYSRIKAIKPSIKKLIRQKNIIFIITHFGRPKGKKINKYSLKFLCSIIEKELQIEKLHFLKKLDQKSIDKKIREMNFGEICLVENIRFFSEEEKNDNNFSKEITNSFDVYVNDAFSASHRNHASIVGFPKYLPAIAGLRLLEEITNIDVFLKNKKKPNFAIIGGSKISTKIKLLNNLVKHFSTLAIGGAMANTFLLSNNYKIGKSLAEKELINIASNIQTKAKKLNCNIILPVDVVCAENINEKRKIRLCDVKNVLSNHMILDVGKKTTKIICDEILKSRMLLWNGPMGVFEKKPFNVSTMQIAKTICRHRKKLKIDSIAGGGDTISSIKSANAEKGFTYMSNAGGAFLEWLEGRESPGVIALKNKFF